MKKITVTLLSLLLAVNFTYAGGLVTNTNQSTAWTRMLVRDASTSIDAVYFNPAGLAKLSDGFYISLSNQSIYQTQTIIANFPYLNNKTYIGTVAAPVFPSLYMAYKTGRFAFSLGVNVIGGGGSATFNNGIPMAEVPIAALSKSLGSLGVTGYSADMFLKGSSVYYGVQFGITYAISDNFSIYAGGRYVIARNSYSGYVNDIKFNLASGGSVGASTFMNGVGDQAMAGSASAKTAGDGLQNWVGAGAGGYTFDQAVNGGVMTAQQKAVFEGALLQFGFTQDQINAMTLSAAQTAFYGTSTALAAKAKQLYGGASLMGNQDIDVKQSGTGFTPIVGANISMANNKIDIGIKYEFITHMTLTNSTPAGKGYKIGLNPDGTPIYMFPDGAKTNADMPSLLSIGINYKVSKVFSLQGGVHMYGDRNTGWKDVKTEIGKNFREYALGAEFNVAPNLTLSAGYLYAVTGVNQSYQSDLSYSLTTNTYGAGGAYKINDRVTFQFGGYIVSYNDKTYSYTQNIGSTPVNYKKNYSKSTYGVSFGLDFKLGKTK